MTFQGAGFHPGNGGGVITGTCGKGGCHDGTNTAGALGKSANHISTAGHSATACDDCHTVALTINYTTFLGATYSHSTPIGVCSTCHNNSTATGQPATHIPTSAPCNQCHALPPPSGSAIDFTGATFHLIAANNAAATGLCQNCHNGSYTTYTSFNGLVPQAKSVPHIPATGSCDACHTAANTANFTTFGGANYNHTGVVAGSCSTCHNGSYPGVTSQTNCLSGGGACPSPSPFAHQATSAPCDQCHNAGASLNYTTWANAGYTHTGADTGQCAKSGCHSAGGSGKGIIGESLPHHLVLRFGGLP